MTIRTIVRAASQQTHDHFHFADATLSNGHLFCSGVIGATRDGSVPSEPVEEFRRAWAHVGEVLAEAGLDYSDIVEYTTFHVGLREHLADFMTARDEVLSPPWPAWTAIGITDLAVPNARVEIRVTARLPD